MSCLSINRSMIDRELRVIQKTVLNHMFYAQVLLLLILTMMHVQTSMARPRRVPGGNQRAVIVDERLAALRAEPHLAAPLVQRLSRGHTVTVIGTRRASDGVVFHRVAVSRRRRGWVQADSLVAPGAIGDDEKLLRLIRGSEDFDRLVRANLFLKFFLKSPLRPAALMLLGEEAEKTADRLSRDAARRLDEREMTAGGAPIHSYFMNYAGLDRYNRLGVNFIYDRSAKRFRYDGASWREIVRRHPHSPEAEGARKRLDALSTTVLNTK